MKIAITRAVSRSIADCQLTHLERTPIDYGVASGQHAEYVRLLAALGCHVIELPALDNCPDAVFVEDTALVLEEVAVICRPGSPARQPETFSIAEALRPFREIVEIRAPGTVDGGDVLRIGKQIRAGLSTRTNEEGVRQLAEILEPWGYDVRGVAIDRALHLKSAVTLVRGGDDPLLLVNPAWIAPSTVAAFEYVETDPSEPAAANALLIDDTVVMPEAFARTRKRLADRGLSIRTVPASELAKAEGGVTCCSLVFEVGRG